MFVADIQKNSTLNNTDIQKDINSYYANNLEELKHIDVPQIRNEEYIQEMLKAVKGNKDLTYRPDGYIMTTVVILDKYKEKPVILSEIIFRNKICKSMFYDLYEVVDIIQDNMDLNVLNK